MATLRICFSLLIATLVGGCTDGPFGRGTRVAAPSFSTTAPVTPIIPSDLPPGPAPDVSISAPQVRPVLPPAHPIVPATRPSLSLSPTRIVAPVGSDVVLIAGVCCKDGTLQTGERIEWSLDKGGVGQIVSPRHENDSIFDRLFDWDSRPTRIDNSYAVGKSSSRNFVLTRGSADKADDLSIRSGQAWLSVTSAIEGTTYVTAYAPKVPNWSHQRQTAQVHWIDAQWRLPAPTIQAADQPARLVTTVSRQSTGAPRAGWIVRYEITTGPDATLSAGKKLPANKGRIMEVTTDANGRAEVEIASLDKTRGSNQISIQIIRPAAAGHVDQLVVGHGVTTATWSAAAIALRCEGPSGATLGSTATYTIDVSNPGDLPARDVVVRVPLPYQGALVGSDPKAEIAAGHATWRLSELAGNETKRFRLDVKPESEGTLTIKAEVTTAEGLKANATASTLITIGNPVSIEIRTEENTGQIAVGQDIHYVIDIKNRTDAALTDILFRDLFDSGFAHPEHENRIRKSRPRINAGETVSVRLTFRVAKAGTICHEFQVEVGGKLVATKRACIEAFQSEAGGQSPLSVTITGPKKATIGQTAVFQITLENLTSKALQNLVVRHRHDAALAVTAVSRFQDKDGELVWRLTSLNPGEKVVASIHCQCKQAVDRACNWITVTGDQVPAATANACLEITTTAADLGNIDSGSSDSGSSDSDKDKSAAAGSSQLRLSIQQEQGPVRVGDAIRYLVTIKNAGRKDATHVTLVVDLPEQIDTATLSVRSFATHSIRQRRLTFTPIAALHPDESLDFQIDAKILTAGQLRIAASLSSDRQSAPLSKEDTLRAN